MHSSRMRTARSLPYRGSLSRGSLSKEVSVQGGLSPGGSLSRGSLSRGASVQWVSVQGGLCPGDSFSRGSMSRGSLSRGSLSRGLSVQGSLSGGLCPGGLCPGDSVSRGLCLGVSVQGSFCQEDPLGGTSDQRQRPPPSGMNMESQTETPLWTENTSENITLSQLRLRAVIKCEIITFRTS